MKSNEELIKGHEREINKLRRYFNDNEISYEVYMESHTAHMKAINSLKKNLGDDLSEANIESQFEKN